MPKHDREINHTVRVSREEIEGYVRRNLIDVPAHAKILPVDKDNRSLDLDGFQFTWTENEGN